MGEQVRAGGCLCGAVRFEAVGEPSDAGYCHCRMCQRWSGAPAQAWATFAPEAVRYTAGAPASYRSSDAGRRQFCAAWGSPLMFDDPGFVSINVASLDDPGGLPPKRHIHVSSRIGWFDAGRGLPEHLHGRE
jgi:hypothetical protein